jgi:hypothetical protein
VSDEPVAVLASARLRKTTPQHEKRRQSSDSLSANRIKRLTFEEVDQLLPDAGLALVVSSVVSA